MTIPTEQDPGMALEWDSSSAKEEDRSKHN